MGLILGAATEWAVSAWFMKSVAIWNGRDNLITSPYDVLNVNSNSGGSIP